MTRITDSHLLKRPYKITQIANTKCASTFPQARIYAFQYERHIFTSSVFTNTLHESHPCGFVRRASSRKYPNSSRFSVTSSGYSVISNVICPPFVYQRYRSVIHIANSPVTLGFPFHRLQEPITPHVMPLWFSLTCVHMNATSEASPIRPTPCPAFPREHPSTARPRYSPPRGRCRD